MLKKGVKDVKMKKYSKGLSTIVATLLIILLTLVAVGIVWAAVRGIVQGGSDQISLGKFNLNLEIKTITRNIDENSMDVRIKRNVGAGDLSGIEFLVDGLKNTEVVDVTNLSLKQLEEQTFTINLTSTNVTELNKVSIAPIFISDSGNEIVGDITDEYIFPKNLDLNVLICVDNCSNLGYDCGIQTICEKEIDCGNCSIGQTCNSIGQCIVPVPIWRPNSTINTSLPIYSFTSSSVFYKDESWYLIGGGGMLSSFPSFVWTGSEWLPNSTINASLPYIADYPVPCVFYKDSSWYMIIGEYTGKLFGYVWNGNQWLPNSTINASLPDVGYNSKPSVFYKDSTWYMIVGEYYGNFKGFAWNGNQWLPNSTINASLPDVGARAQPKVFYKDSSWYLLSGNGAGNVYGFAWNGNQWLPNSIINASLPVVGAISSPEVFYKDSSWYLLNEDGETGAVYGFVYT